MISEYLDRGYVLDEMRRQLASLQTLQAKVKAKDKQWLAALKKEGLSPAQLADLIAVLKKSVAEVEKDTKHPQGSAFIPSDPLACGMQAGLTEMAKKEEEVEKNKAPVVRAADARTRGRRGTAAAAPETSPQLRLKNPVKPAPARRGQTRGLTRGGAFIEGEDPHYALDGIKAKFGALFQKRRRFNDKPAKIATTNKPLTLFLFGDWGTGLPLAAAVTEQIRKQLVEKMDGSTQPHVIHLGDVYYVGEKQEYIDRMLPFWPVRPAERDAIGSWSLNGNHDMYSGGHAYFDTLLRQKGLIRWHGDDKGEPSSFFLIENDDWQVFGLDTSWNIPSLGSAIIGEPTMKDYGGQNGFLTDSQVRWMARQRNTAKGCIMLTHHQPASSRSTEDQHADQAVKLLKEAGLYSGIDAWIWGHEHRCVVYKPKAGRTTKRLKDAPEFCACLGHAGVPVTAKNFEAGSKIPDIKWEEDRFDASAPIYEGQRVLPFGFARIDTSPGSFVFTVFDYSGAECKSFTATRQAAAPAGTRGTRRSIAPAAKKAAKKTAKKAAKKATAKTATKAARKAVKKTAARKTAKAAVKAVKKTAKKAAKKR